MSNVPLETTDPPVAAKLTPEEAVAALRDLRDRLPLPDGAEIPVSKRRRAGMVDKEFAAAAANASGVIDVVQTAVGFTDADVRNEMDAATRWTAFTDELRALLSTATNADTVRRQRIGLASMQTYKICQQLARDDRNAARLGPHIAEMKRLNMFRRGRRQKAQQPGSTTTPAPGPAPAPAPNPAPVPPTVPVTTLP
jgi:hypothetical protein